MLIGGGIGQVWGRVMCRSAKDTLLAPVLDTWPLWWEPLILHTKQGNRSTNHTSERLQDTSFPWAPGGNVTGSTGARAFERDLEDDPQLPLVHFSLRGSNCLLRTEYAGVSGCRCEFPGVSGCRCECTGMSSHRCEGGGTGTPELPGPVLREGKLETGSVPTAKRPRPGISADTSKCSST